MNAPEATSRAARGTGVPMFEQSLVESTGALRTGNRKPAVISVSLQLLIVAALLIWPLMHPEVVLPRTLPMTLFAPPKAPTPPPPQRVRLVDMPTSPVMMTTSSAPIIRSEPAAPHSDAPPAFSPIQIGGGDSNAPLPFATNGSATTGPAIAVMPSTPTHPAGPTAISSGVSAGLLLTPIQPLYPNIARQAHIQGTVMVSAIISKSGHIESARATAGPEMLRNAAVDSVRNARYKPFLLNNQPTEVEANFSIHFQLNQ